MVRMPEIDLDMYIALQDYFNAIDVDGRTLGRAQAAWEWFEGDAPGSPAALGREGFEYVMHAVARMHAHPKGDGWDDRPPEPDLDRLAWTFHRAWVDRYGWRPTTDPS